jgi:hypothetical protein
VVRRDDGVRFAREHPEKYGVGGKGIGHVHAGPAEDVDRGTVDSRFLVPGEPPVGPRAPTG